jgi:DNA-binding XRE family transcriptional regulator
MCDCDTWGTRLQSVRLNKCYKLCCKGVSLGRILLKMLSPSHLSEIRRKLGLTQEEMARVLAVSFVSVNRWEGGHSSPSGPIHDLYAALDAAIRAGNSPEAIRQATKNERGAFLYCLFRMAYARPQRRSR